MELRPARADDAVAISRLIASVAHYFTVDPGGKGAERFFRGISPQAIRGYINDPAFYYVAAWRGNELAGAAALRNGSHLFHLFVAPAYQRQGLSRRLWEMLQAGADPGCGMFTVNSSPYAVAVYQRFGFVATGPPVVRNGITFVPMKTGATPP